MKTENNENINCIVLAAGLSRRAQTNKLLKTVQGKPLYRFILQTLATVRKQGLLGDGKIVVVTNYSTIVEEARSFGFMVQACPQAALGKSYSIKAGLTFLYPQLPVQSNHRYDFGTAFFVADQPFISIATISKLVEQYRQKNCIVYPCHGQRRGNPVIFPPPCLNDLYALSDDQGGAKIIANHLSCTVMIDDEKEFQDFDYLEDFKR